MWGVLRRHWVAIISVAILAATTTYAAVWSSRLDITNADATASTFMVAEPFAKDGVRVMEQHTNLFKLPALAVQGNLPYTKLSFIALNCVLVLAAIFGWLVVLVRLTKKDYIPHYALGLSILVIASATFMPQFVSTTIRNVEFPLTALFFMVIASWLFGKLRLLPTLLAAAVFAVVVSSDYYLLYCAMPALLLAIGIVFLGADTRKLPRRRVVGAGVIALATAVGAKVGNAILSAVGVLAFDGAAKMGISLGSLQELLSGMLSTFQLMLHLMGANIFSQQVDDGTIFHFLVLVLTCFAIARVVRMTRWSWSEARRDPIAFVTLAAMLWGVMTIAFFVLTGQYRIANTSRYLVLLPLLLVAAAPYIIPDMQKFIQKMTWIAPAMQKTILRHLPTAVVVLTGVIILGGLIVSTRGYRHEFADRQPRYTFVTALERVVAEERVTVGIGGFWEAMPARFISQDKVFIVPVTDCYKPLPYLSHKTWYTPQQNTRTFMLVDRHVPDGPIWQQCSEDQLESVYGRPEKKVEVPAIGGDGTATMWIYPFDIRSQLQR